jgi:hypothetical protein
MEGETLFSFLDRASSENRTRVLNARRRRPKRARKKIKNANRRKKNAISTVARLNEGQKAALVGGETRRRRALSSFAILLLTAERENAQRGDAAGAEDENNIHQRVRFTERNTGGKVEKENKENDRRKGRRSDAKEFGHIAVPKGAKALGSKGTRSDETSPKRRVFRRGTCSVKERGNADRNASFLKYNLFAPKFQ